MPASSDASLSTAIPQFSFSFNSNAKMRTTRAVWLLLAVLVTLLHLICGVAAARNYNNNNIYINNNNVNRMPPMGQSQRGAMNMPPNRYQNQNQNPNQIHNNNNNNREHQYDVPKSREELRVRQIMATEMGNYMDPTLDPCEDFFNYACGNWAQYHTRQLRDGELGTAQQMVESSIVDKLGELLKLPITPQHHPNEYSSASAANVRKVVSFYDSCIAIEANAQERQQFMIKILQKHGGLRNLPISNYQSGYTWQRLLSELRKNYGLDILIGLSVDLNLEQMRGNSIYLGEPKLTIIPQEHCNTLSVQEAEVNSEIYNVIQQQVANNLHDWLEMETGEAARFAGDIIRFEFELCKRMHESDILPPPPDQQQPEQVPVYTARSRTGQDRLRQQSGNNSPYPRRSLADVDNQLGANTLSFKQFVESIVDGSHVDYVYLRSQSYLSHMVRTIKSNNHLTISGYILYVALSELNSPPEEEGMLRPQQCVRVMQRLFPQALGDMFQHHVRQNDAQNDIEQIFDDVIKAFEQQLKVEWMTENDRRAARTRLVQYHTQFPDYQGVDLSELRFDKDDDYWRKLEITLRFNAHQQLNSLRGNDFGQPDDGGLDAFEVRAGLMPRKHEILVGWGLLQSPYYSYYYPKALKYALLGQRLASALLYAFDDDGWNKYPQATSPWSEETMSGYRNVSECQRAQYSNYLTDEPNEFRNATRLRQIIAESSALNVAFNAYLSWLEQLDPKLKNLLSRETLPELNYTNTQLFFIYFAQTRCWAKLGEEPPPKGLPLMLHTPERWDVNGPLSNSEEFGREFGCALGSQMNSGNKCLVY
ncbi:neprilysin-4 isoform X2 [Drosophila sulfurigaster albostrigata]|uniref:neprilysin-4 isoform X2 n=1 Tax=Drosophila sulfurigaster albostrigata TaxID=89887 RepID=UPI002D219CAB|nr:neprilysin-4 isoform X2 [Drosophila sulfurigaster albostrigata]